MDGLRTERLLLRRWRDSDRAPFATMNADPEVMEFFPAVMSREESDGLVDRIEAHFDQHGFGLYAVEIADGPGGRSGGFIGFVGLSTLPFADEIEIGWRLDRAAWGRGYATEAAQRLVAHAFGALEIGELVSITSIGNRRSRAVMDRIGMHRDPVDDFDHPNIPEGHPLRRHVLYRLHAPAGR